MLKVMIACSLIASLSSCVKNDDVACLNLDSIDVRVRRVMLNREKSRADVVFFRTIFLMVCPEEKLGGVN